jgi:hypothetical protein
MPWLEVPNIGKVHTAWTGRPPKRIPYNLLRLIPSLFGSCILQHVKSEKGGFAICPREKVFPKKARLQRLKLG